MIAVKSKIKFRDLENGVVRLPGDVFEVSQERADKLSSLGFVDALESSGKKEEKGAGKTKEHKGDVKTK